MKMRALAKALTLTLALAGSMAGAQVRTVDPNQAIDRDLGAPSTAASTPPTYATASDPVDPAPSQPAVQATSPAVSPSQARADATTQAENTYERDDLLAAAEGVFGKGAQGLAGILEKVLKEQGRPNAYIAGREASGAIVVGLRYGSGVMTHKVEGQQPVYWTGPSLGFDVGGDANKVFVLVYNLYDTEDLFHRFPAAEGRLYFVGGFAATYLRRGNVVLIPIRLGVGWRAGVNVGYMNFTHKSRLLPF
ncbi:hypothetical protein SAMN05192583_1085 [Sphingomonas gellani]|uniref:DUF1134 domain-containing protein n=1 Tax=Sphingomonas gellani TaxID=1166340 RepID=A0A1H8AVH4_9SPHN|nr:DUF1134 domain-containing protein [Sphingomonas gellani]SEM74821.1 hypothetical protein SAMN05192583_1085 [Sphingomonas gellani]